MFVYLLYILSSFLFIFPSLFLLSVCFSAPAVSESTHKEPVVIPFSDLHLGKEVGEGTFGVVRKGYRTSLDGRRHQVAIKQLKGVDKFEVRLANCLLHIFHPLNQM